MKEEGIQQDVLRDFLNLYWLRPEVALFLAISCEVLQKAPYLPVEKPSLDLGAGNGLFSFVAMGGSLTEDYDVYLNVKNLEGYWQNQDIYDHFSGKGNARHIARRPNHTFSYALDYKENLKKQALFLGLYDEYRVGDANSTWPFEEGGLKTVFSNIFYWLKDPHFLFKELGRVLMPQGRAFLALQDSSFPRYCLSSRSQDFPKYRKLFELLNRGRSDSYLWRLDLVEIEELAKTNRLKFVYHRHYLSEVILKIWDIGLRPLSPVLIRMANSLSPQARMQSKKEWVAVISKLLESLFEAEREREDPGGYLYLILEKI